MGATVAQNSEIAIVFINSDSGEEYASLLPKVSTINHATDISRLKVMKVTAITSIPGTVAMIWLLQWPVPTKTR